MKQGVFVEGLSNEVKFLSAVRAKKNRANPEANWQLVQGDVGFGKGRTVSRFAVQEKTISVRAKSDWTPNWALRDICAAMGLKAMARTEAMLNNVVAELCREQPILIVDEIDHAARSIRVLETLRDITDTAEIILIAIGMKDAYSSLKRYPQIRRRTSVVNFGPLTDADVRKVLDTLAEAKIADDMIPLLQRETQGHISELRDAIITIEARFRTSRELITADKWGGKTVLPEGKAASLKLAVSNG